MVHYDSDTCAASSIEIDNLVNKSYKVGGKNVTYKVVEDGYLSVP